MALAERSLALWCFGNGGNKPAMGSFLIWIGLGICKMRPNRIHIFIYIYSDIVFTSTHIWEYISINAYRLRNASGAPWKSDKRCPLVWQRCTAAGSSFASAFALGLSTVGSLLCAAPWFGSVSFETVQPFHSRGTSPNWVMVNTTVSCSLSLSTCWHLLTFVDNDSGIGDWPRIM